MKRLWKLTAKLALLAGILNLIIEGLERKTIGGLVDFVIGKPLVFVLNGLIILVPFLLVLFTRRKVFAAAFLSALMLLIGIVNGILLIFRTTPFTAADFRLIRYGAALLTTYFAWWQIAAAIAALTMLFFACFLLWRKAPIDREPVRLLPSLGVAGTVFLGVVLFLNFSIFCGVVDIHFGNIGQGYLDYGVAYGFSNSMFNRGIPKPKDYSSEAVAQVEETLGEETSLEPEKKSYPDVIMLQLESFFDPMLWENSQLSEDPIPYFRQLLEEYPSGWLSVPSVGAGTANTEFECITGMNLDFFGPGEYPYTTVLQTTICESMAFDLKELGYTAHAIHNNEATFYDRHKVFSQLGFDTFTPIEYMYEIERNPTGWCRDRILTKEIRQALDSTAGSDFIYTISVQGHGKYPSFAYYCSQIAQMDEFVKELVEMLEKRGKPAVLVMYGDHLPGFEWEAEDMKNRSLYQTQYVVWNNLGLKPQKQDVEAYQLAAHVMNLMDIHEGTMMRFHQRHLAAGDTGTKAYLDAMRVLEYDILYGEQEVYGGSSPYQATELTFGTRPIVQNMTIHNSDQVIIFGENFNDYSKIFVNGKQVDTPYYGEKRLIAPNVPKQENEVITVRQVGRDKVPLGEAERDFQK